MRNCRSDAVSSTVVRSSTTAVAAAAAAAMDDDELRTMFLERLSLSSGMVTSGLFNPDVVQRAKEREICHVLNASGNEGTGCADDSSSSSDEEHDGFDGSRGVATSNASKWGADAVDVLEKMALLVSESGSVQRCSICIDFKRRFGFDPSVGLNIKGRKKSKQVANVLVDAGICAIEKRANVNGKITKKFLVPIASFGEASSEPATQLPNEVIARILLCDERANTDS